MEAHAAVGKSYPPTTYAVGREKIREYAYATGESNLLHLDLEAYVGHVVGIEVGDVTFLEGRARDSDRPPLKIEDALGINRGKRRPRVDCRQHCAFCAAYIFAFSAQVGFG